MSTHYLGMIEIARNFPTADMIERLAAALEINPSELFSVSDYPEMAMEQLQKAILDILDKKLDNLDQTIEQALDKAIEKRSGDVHLISDCPPEKTNSKKKKKSGK